MINGTQVEKSTEAEDTETGVDERTERALTEYLTVTECDTGDEHVVEVHSQSGETYVVDVVEGNCGCPDAEYNLDEDTPCKHVRRARFALGLDAVPSDAAEALDVDPSLGCGTDADLRFAASDGGVIEAGDDAEVLTDDEREECDECAELDGVACFECYMNERGHSVNVGGA
jgi:hypothetical protein